jgi:hypothetical protein
MSSLETNGPPQLELVRSYLKAFENGDIGRIGKSLHKDYHRAIYPRSIGRPVQAKEEYIKHLEEVVSRWNDGSKVSYVGCCPIFLAPDQITLTDDISLCN